MHFAKLLNRFGKTASHDRYAYREYQMEIGRYYLENFVRPFARGNKVFDIGCAEGGMLTVFHEEGYECSGLECSPHRIEYAKLLSSPNIHFFCGDIESFSVTEQFDVILMLDVIEHVDNKIEALENIKQLLASDGIVIISFPPFRSPFGGHQQVMRSFLKFIPYVHLLPEKIYGWLLQKVERENTSSHHRNYSTGLTIGQFEQLINQVGFKTTKKLNYLVRPRQALKFDLKVRKNWIPALREYLTTGVDYVLTV